MTQLLKLLLCLGLLTACNAQAAQDNLPSNPPPTQASQENTPAETTLHCRIVDGAEDGTLLLADLNDAHGVYRISAGSIPVVLDGKPADRSALTDGMPLDVTFSGTILETFPAQLDGVTKLEGQTVGGTYYDLCGLYLQVLDDLWNKDPGLNSDIRIAGLDLSQAPGGLTDSEKTALAWRFGEMHDVEVVTGTFEELDEQGYFTTSAISTPAPDKEEDSNHLWTEWKDGCLFSITPNVKHEEEIYSLPPLFFNVEKWRSPLGAYCFYDCSAVWPEFGTWSSYNIGSEMIS